jgi:hypothetical protein
MSITVSNAGLARAWYGDVIKDFLARDTDDILGKLSRHAGDGHFADQRGAWITQIDILRSQLEGMDGWVFFEFNIPRMGRRVDVILVLGSVIFVLEFKVGEKIYDRVAIEQVWDYALDLKNFHEASHNVAIAPILVATEAAPTSDKFVADEDKVYRPVLTNAATLRKTLERCPSLTNVLALDAQVWARASYRPTPTIIEAARSLYAQHCFVTGVPGAGKTLVGLNIATQRRDEKSPTHAVFLSGNGPLVAVLREALTRDEYFRLKAQNKKKTRKKIADPIKAFIQNVHHFRDAGLMDETENTPPPEHVVIFDEAQRAWNLQKTSDFMKRKKGHPDFIQSEPEFLISYMNRHQDWAVIICLVGGGQEINTGEAGISAWLNAVIEHFPKWKMFVSSRLHDSEYAAKHTLELAQCTAQTHHEDSLHLAVPMRSFRAENVSACVKALLDCEANTAREKFIGLKDRFPIVVARDLGKAKEWVRSNARGSERFGLLASSKAMRLKPHAIDVRVPVDPVHYFLNDSNDVRSSYYLEDAATEFQVQGLELDWTCVTWDGDFRFNGTSWSHHDFRGKRWNNIKSIDNKNYLKNAYRVLLTRARQGMVVFVPPGDESDPTRSPAFYDSTFNYLRELGIPALI